MSNSKDNKIQRREEILTAAFDHFTAERRFPEYKKFRLQFEHDWALLDELTQNNFFNPNTQYSYKEYVLRIKSLLVINTDRSKEILSAANRLIDIFKKFYRFDQSDNKFWTINEIVDASELDKDTVEVALFFLEDMYFLGGYQVDPQNEFLKTSVSVRERVLTLTSVEDFLEKEYKSLEQVRKKSFRVTLVLGAGLGVEYGYPDGNHLKELIAKELLDSHKQLKDILYWTPAETVDEIAARHPEYADILRQIVIKILCEREEESKLGVHKNNTYKLLIKQIAAAKEKGYAVNILTFNYDRSLQWMINRINQIEPEHRRINHTLIIPIYGRLAPFIFEDTDEYRKQLVLQWGSVRAPLFWEYGGIPCPEGTNQEYWNEQRLGEMLRESKLKFIGEMQEGPDENIKKILEASDEIFFLGCGYHQANLDVLGLDFSIKHPDKLIAGTGLGLSRTEIESIQLRNPGIDHIEEGCDAFTFLKRKFDISDPSKNVFKKSNALF